MAVQEIAKHTKKLIHSASSEHGLAHRLREIALEIFIIVFAVTLSIWLHGLSEHRHEQKQVEAFLLGLKRDLQGDIVQINEIVASQRAFDANYAYLGTLGLNAPDDKQFDAAVQQLAQNSFLVPQTSRYEGFKSSGKLTNIGNPALLDAIVSLYQYDIPKVNMSWGGWSRSHEMLTTYLEEQTDDADLRASRLKALAAPKGKRLLMRMQTHPQLYERYATVASKSATIIKEIDKAYPGN